MTTNTTQAIVAEAICCGIYGQPVSALESEDFEAAARLIQYLNEEAGYIIVDVDTVLA